MNGTNMHLTETELNDALIGDLAAAASAHLSGCAACQQQVAEVQFSLNSFKAVSLAWSERRSATLPVSLSGRILHGAAGSRRLAWGTAVVALLAVTVAAPFQLHRGSALQSIGATETAQVGTAQAMGVTGVVSGQKLQPEIAPEQIDSDNQMLSEIDRELDSNRASSEAMAFQADPHSAEHTAARMLQD